MNGCELCVSPGGEVLWRDGLCRVVRVDGTDGDTFPGFCRVIWNMHVAEMSDLDSADRRHFMNVVFATEAALRTVVAHGDDVKVAARWQGIDTDGDGVPDA